MNCLQNGLTRDFVLNGCLGSEEFSNICLKHGIDQGEMILSDIRDQNPNITRFVHRNYKQFLSRNPDTAGLINWVSNLSARVVSPTDVAFRFVFSEELTQKRLSDKEFVRVLYKGLFDREPDEEGFSNWINYLKDGNTRNDAFWGFANSEEFNAMVRSFGL